MFNADANLMEKWGPVLNHESAPAISDNYKKAVTARLLENQEVAMRQEAAERDGNFITETAANATSATNIKGFDPVLISLVRRAMPNLIAYDIAGVQPMNGPTGLIFAMKSKYATQGGTEALFNEADTDFSGTGTQGGGSTSLVGDVLSGETSADAGSDGVEDVFGVGTGMDTSAAEALGNTGGNFGEMSFSIEK